MIIVKPSEQNSRGGLHDGSLLKLVAVSSRVNGAFYLPLSWGIKHTLQNAPFNFLSLILVTTPKKSILLSLSLTTINYHVGM